MKDYLIVGGGLAGITFAETAISNGKICLVIDNESTNSSKVAAGVYNPVVLKRLNAVGNAAFYLAEMHDFYAQLKRRLGSNYKVDMPVLRMFASIEEQNSWFAAADKPALGPYLSTVIERVLFPGVDAPYGFGRVSESGWVDTRRLVDDYRAFLRACDSFLTDSFDAGKMTIGDMISYDGMEFRHLVFADGFGMVNNPFFKQLPLQGTKGEILTIRSSELKLTSIIKAGVFVLPIGDDLFKVGATYNRDDKTETPTSEARAELEEKLQEFIKCKYEIVDHEAAIRPTVRDRKPLIGTHPDYPLVHLLNGLGTRGVMLAPALARQLFASIEKGVEFPPEVNLTRFL